jgi:hypothetical protein
MTITLNRSAFVGAGGQTLDLSAMFSVTPGTSNPAYLVLTAIDREEYTAGTSGSTGTFSGNGNTGGFTGSDGDGREVGVVFAYQASTGRYYNPTYGYFDQVQYTSSTSLGDVTNISVFATNDSSIAANDAADVYAMMQDDPEGFDGSVTVATQPGLAGPVPSQATPLSIAAAAESFVGDAWNMDGCWVLASTIAAEAGAGLPVESTAIGLPGEANGEWLVAFDGPAGQSGNWQSLVKTGEVIVLGTPGGGGHITTCVASYGVTAMLVDNATYENQFGQITNAANDGSADDVLVAAPHPASQEWAGVQASSVVIYELDTPILSTASALDNVTTLTIQTLSSLFKVTDPGNKAIAEYQVYDTAAAGSFLISGVSEAAHTAATALTLVSLNSAAYVAAPNSETDTLDIRAFNGSYWSDWTSLNVAVASPTPVAAAPDISDQTAAQTWMQGQRVSFTLPANTFTDPQGEVLTFAATLATGAALPVWLAFNATTESFTGQVPTGLQSFAISVSATDTSGLTASEQFTVTVPAAAPILTVQTQGQQWIAGEAISLRLSAATFTDPQGEALSYSATQANGQALPSWLTFNAATDSFSGTAPINAQTLGLKVTATDTSGLSTSEIFPVSVSAAAPVLANQTGNITEVDGKSFTFMLPANTFTDTASQQLSYLAYQIGGASVTSWLHFKPSTETLSGTPPVGAYGTARIEIVATDSNHFSATETFSLSFSPGR